MLVTMKTPQHLLLIATSLSFAHLILSDESVNGRLKLVDHNGIKVSEAN